MTTTAQQHVIRRQVLDVTVNGTETEGFALQGKLVALCRDWLTTALDDALARASPGNERWSIDRLDVDAGAFTLDSLERDFVDAVRTALEGEIRERSSGRSASARSDPSALAADRARQADSRSSASPGEDDSDIGFSRRTDAQATQDAFVYFLATGVLPWWFRLPPNETLESFMTTTWNAEGSLLFAVPSTLRAIASPVARLRLVRQFSGAFLETLLKVLSSETARVTEQIAQQVMAQPVEAGRQQRFRERLWLPAFEATALRREISLAALFADWSRAIRADGIVAPEDGRVIADVARALSLPAPAAQRSSALPLAKAKTATIADEDPPAADPARGIGLDEGVFVDGAGIVLLHPFLPALFERLGVASEGKLIQPDRALSLLHFLATRETRAPEYALLLPKLLCGLPLDEPVGPPVDLTEAEVAEAENLLVAVIGHWEALGDASPDALRGTFLARPGKLSRRDDDDLLQIEPQSFDVLLDRLPWGIGAVRLPWMARMLWVEWRM